MLNEVLPGLFHWSVRWPGWWSLESYWIRTDRGGVLIDPIECFGLDDIEQSNDVKAIFVTLGWHERSARLFAMRTGAEVFVPERDRSMIEDIDRFTGYGDGFEHYCGFRAIGVPGLTPGEQAILSDAHGGTLFVGDALGTTAKWAPNGLRLGGHPNGHPQPSQTLSHLLSYEFENLMPGHGEPIIGGARDELARLIESGISTSTGPQHVTWVPSEITD